MALRKWRCPYCGWFAVFRLYLNRMPLEAYACGNCAAVVNSNDIPNLPSKLTNQLPNQPNDPNGA